MNTHVRERENYVPAQPTTFLTLTTGMRTLLEAAVEDALDFAESMTLFLDEIDGDEGREDDDADEDGGDSEPSLGWVGNTPGHMSGSTDDREEEHDGSEPDVDEEPSLGASEKLEDQRSWTAGQSYEDLEQNDGDLEPSLGWTTSGGISDARDLEDDFSVVEEIGR